jgi:hypothetical protein
MKKDMSLMLQLIAIIANNRGITTKQLANILKVPEGVVLRNLELISYNPEFRLLDIYSEEHEDAIMDLGDMTWNIACEDEEDSDDIVYLCINSVEKFLFESLVANAFFDDEILGIRIKSTHGLAEQKDKFLIITLAIENRKKLKVKYKTRYKTSDFLIEPLRIVYYEIDNMVYIIGQHNGRIATYRLDRMIEIKATNERFEPIGVEHVESLLEYSWGMEQGNLFNVKVKFLDEANVIYKVKRDLSHRKNKKITEYEGYIIYEDTIAVINSFKRWLRSYGSSAIVLEPEELRNDMIRSAEQCLSYYIE